MSKQQVLTQEDVARYSLNPEILRYLESFRESLGRERSEFRVLDFGCGRGEAVVKLRHLGFHVMGADIDPMALENGRRYFENVGIPPGSLIQIDRDGRVEAPDGSFDFVYSETVLEHVRDLELVAAEMSRIMAAPSAAFHAFPARRHVVEQHLRMPFVHWLPKNGLRTMAIALCVGLGMEPHWQKERFGAKVRRYSAYSRDVTFYRRHEALRTIFSRHGFQVDFVSIDHPKLASNRTLRHLLRRPVARDCINWLLLNFKTVEMSLHKPAAQTRPVLP